MTEPFEPVFTGFYRTRGQRSRRRFTEGAHYEHFFPARHTIDNGTSSWYNLFYELYNPLHPPLRDGIPYEDLSTVFYNVKEWRFTGSVAGYGFNFTVPAGCIGDYTDDFPPETSDPPNDGLRGIYCARFSNVGWTGTETTSDVGYAGVGIGCTISNTPPTNTTPAEVLSPSSTNPFTFIPFLDIKLRHTYSDDENPGSNFDREIRAVPNSTPEPTEDANVTFLGIPLHTHPAVDGAPADYSLDITAEAYWTAADEWVRQW